MASAAPSILSLSAAGLYMLVLGMCLFAGATAGRRAQPFAHRRTWVVIGLVFGLLALMRIAGTEEFLRDLLRAELRLEGSYDRRRELQRPLVVIVMCIFAGLFLWGLLRQWRAAHGRRSMALFIAFAAVASMMFLVALRTVSFHQVDILLYGPAKLNWIMDIGASLTVLAAAGYYVRLVSNRF